MEDREHNSVKRMLTFNPEADAGNEEKVNEFLKSFKGVLMSKDPAIISAVNDLFSSFDKLDVDSKNGDYEESNPPSEDGEIKDVITTSESSIVHNSELITRINDWLYI